MTGDESRKTELLVGLFLFVGLLLLGALILQFSRIRESWKEKYSLEVAFPSAAGLVEGAPVKLGGATIGEVATRPRLNKKFNGVLIDLEIFSEYQIPEGSEFSIGSSGLMGDKLLEIRPPDPGEITGEFIPPNTIHVGEGASGLGAIEDAAISLTRKTGDVLEDVEEGIELLTETVRNLDASFLNEENAESFKRGLSGLGKAVEKIDGEILSDENIDSVGNILAGFEETAENLREGSGSLEEAMEKLAPAVEKLDPSLEKLESVLDRFAEAADAVKETAEMATAKVSTIDGGEGLLPALLEDEKLKGEFSGLISNLKRHGILRYKDSASAEAPGSGGAAGEKGEGAESTGASREGQKSRGARGFGPFRR